MKLYNVPRNTKIKVNDLILNFKHIDGMYSLCYDMDNNPVHVGACIEVEIIEETEHE